MLSLIVIAFLVLDLHAYIILYLAINMRNNQN